MLRSKGQSIGVDLAGILRGTHGGTYYKSPAVEAHIFLHCNASNLVLKILQHDKIWGGGAIPPLQILGGGLFPHPPMIYAHGSQVKVTEWPHMGK